MSLSSQTVELSVLCRAVRAGKHLQVLEHGERILLRNPWDVPAHLAMAVAFEELGLGDLAVWTLEQARQIDPNSVEALNNLALVYRKTGDPRARGTAEKAYALAPGSAIVGDTLGWLLVESGEVAKGLPLLQKAAASRPDDPEIQYHAAVGLYRSGERDKARQSLQALLATRKDFPQRADAEALLKAP